jgi:putative Ca2+/H+ antiporter (TMEM165/GDT1 family)
VITFLLSALVVAIAEMGDKSQILAMVLATRFKRPLPIILAIVVATIANHLLAASGGYFLANAFNGRWFRYLVAFSFLAVAAWTLIPDRTDVAPGGRSRNAFLATLVSFFFVEIGDKTQIATVALAAHFHSIVVVTGGTVLGVAAADAPAVLLADVATKYIPLRVMHGAAAAMFLALGLWAFYEALSA